MTAAVVWFRNDLRLHDHPALDAALSSGKPVVPVFIWSPDDASDWPPGSATKWWLHHSLTSLNKELVSRGSRLIVRTGESQTELQRVIDETSADAIYWNRRYEPAGIAVDKQIKQLLRDDGLTVESFPGNLLHEPWTIETQQGKPYQVFTPFWKACQECDVSKPIVLDDMEFPAPRAWTTSESINSLKLLPKIDWDIGFYSRWVPGREGAEQMLGRFLDRITAYADQRNFPAVEGTSSLSPHLHFGELSPREVWRRVHDRTQLSQLTKSETMFLNEIGWREFAHHVLYHFPQTIEKPLRENFENFPWKYDKKAFRAWAKGETGYPIVDAGMRELWVTGWMHNRVRMIVGSLLTKHLLMPWQEGARWFWDTLVDADLANNTLGWQWIAGCGADAAPYFRIFNPTTQSEKFDPDGEYIRRWIPELANLPTKWIHQPWDAPAEVLAEADVRLGGNYPRPIVDHREGRERALKAFDDVKG